MPDTPQNESKSPIKYAEGVLEVHATYDGVQKEQEAYEEALRQHDIAVAGVRTMEETLEDAEALFASELRATNSEMSQTAFEKELKIQSRSHEPLKQLRSLLLEAKSERDAAASAVEIHKSRVRVGVARLEELAGLLHFYAMRTPPPKPT